MMELDILVREDVDLVFSPDRDLTIKSPIYEQCFKALPVGTFAAVEALKQGNCKEDDLMKRVIDSDGMGGVIQFSNIMRTLREMGFLCYSLITDSGLDALMVPMSHKFSYNKTEVNSDTKFELTQFAYFRKNGKKWILESPLGFARIEFGNARSASVVMSLVNATSLKDLQKQFKGFQLDVLEELVEFLIAAELVFFVDGQAEIKEKLKSWEFHDLLFHSRSRVGRHNYPYGGTYRFKNEIVFPPAVRPEFEGQRFSLSTPDLEKLMTTSPPISKVIESRTSIRNYGEEPINITQLGEFLYQVGRIKSVSKTDHASITKKPYPSGGSLYELEIYTIINNCKGVESGCYHYSSLAHELVKVAPQNQLTDRMINLAWVTASKQSRPQVMIIITARFKRLMLKYQSVAYALILKHVGVLYNQMYLVATAMDLAPCALGGGDADLFAEITKIDYYEEAAVGEFLIGSVAPNTKIN